MKKIIILIFIVPLFLGFRTGQEIDEKKMNRDLEIAKNILSTLIKTGADNWFGSSSIEASYIKGYGVVFTIPEYLVYFHSSDGFISIPDVSHFPEPMPVPDFDFHIDVDVDEDIIIDERASREEMERAREEMVLKQEEMKEKQEKMKERQKEMKKRQKDMEVAFAEAKELNEFLVTSKEKSEVDWEKVMITFMTDYADLIGQLQPEEKIVINQKSPHRNLVVIRKSSESVEKQENKAVSISAEVLRKDISSYKSGKINRDDFIKKIKITKVEPQKKIPDLEMFASIFDRFYSRDLSESYYSQNTPNYEVLDGFGAVFHIKTHSPNYTNRRLTYYGRGTRTSSIGSSAGESADNNLNEEALYSTFKEGIKGFLLDYGRTIRSLKDDEKVMLDIKIQACNNCEVPKSLEVTANLSTLTEYDQQKISKDKAIDRIEIKEVF